MSTDLSAIRLPFPPWLLKTTTNVRNIDSVVENTGGDGEFAIRCIDGRKMKNISGLFEEFGQSLNFPDYYGHNSAALRECLTDLSWIPAIGYVLVIPNASDMLANEPSSELTWLTSLLERVCGEWGRPINLGEAWDRPAVPFHVLFQYERVTEYLLPPQISSLPAI